MPINRLTLIPHLSDIAELIQFIVNSVKDGEVSPQESQTVCYAKLYPLLESFGVHLQPSIKEFIPVLLPKLYNVSLVLINQKVNNSNTP